MRIEAHINPLPEKERTRGHMRIHRTEEFYEHAFKEGKGWRAHAYRMPPDNSLDEQLLFTSTLALTKKQALEAAVAGRVALLKSIRIALTAPERRPREYFEGKLREILTALDKENEKTHKYNDALWSWDKAVWKDAVSRVEAVWVFGSFFRGALDCGDLDLIADIQSTPETKSIEKYRAFWGRKRLSNQGVHIAIGTPDKGGTTGLQDGIKGGYMIIWRPGMNWRTAIESIKPDISASRLADQERGESALEFREEQVSEAIHKKLREHARKMREKRVAFLIETSPEFAAEVEARKRIWDI